MSRPPKPWYRKQTKTWYVNIDGERFNLGKDRKVAHCKFHELMANPSRKVTSEHVVVILDKFLDWVKGHRPDSFNWYRTYLKSFKDYFPTLLIHELSPDHVEEWSNEGSGKRPKITVLKRAMSWATNESRLIKTNPIIGMKRPGQNSREEIVSSVEFKALLGLVVDSEFRALLKFAWETGCRPQEAIRIQKDQVELIERRIIFRVADSKGKKKARVIYLTKAAVSILKPLIASSNGYVFLNTQGNPWKSNAVRCRFRRLEKRLGKRVCLYDFRHTFITRKLKAGVDPITLANLVGHNNTAMIARTYAHLSQDKKFLLSQLDKN